MSKVSQIATISRRGLLCDCVCALECIEEQVLHELAQPSVINNIM